MLLGSVRTCLLGFILSVSLTAPDFSGTRTASPSLRTWAAADACPRPLLPSLGAGPALGPPGRLHSGLLLALNSHSWFFSGSSFGVSVSVSVRECTCPCLPQLVLWPAQVHVLSWLLPHDNPERAQEGERPPGKFAPVWQTVSSSRKTTTSNLTKESTLLGWAPPKLAAIIWVTRNTQH